MANALSRLVPWLPGAQRRAASAHAAAQRAPDQKASRTGAIIAIDNLRRPVWTPRDYAAFAREGYMQNAIVYRSVRMVAEAAASIPVLLYDGDNEIDAHPLLDLIARPAPLQTATDFFEAWYGGLLVAGNTYAEAVAYEGELRELHVLRADRMKVIPGAEGWPEAYEYAVNGQSVRFGEEVVDGVQPILHLKLFHPANDHYGMSPLEAAATAIDIHNTAAQWNKALLDNSARPSGALVYTGGEGRLTAEQFERLRNELEEGFQGARQAGRPLLLEGGLDWKALGLTPKDMDFIEAKNAAAREIALALGVPPMLLGIPGDNTFSNYQEAQRAFWRGTVLPLFNRTMKAMSAWLSPGWDNGLELRGDLDQIEALTIEREALWARLQATSFLTDDEKRAAIGYGPMPVEATETPASAPEPMEQDTSPFDDTAGKYWADQPRVPAGNSEGGQWTGGSGASPSAGADQLVRVADAGYDIANDAQDDAVSRAISRYSPSKPGYHQYQEENEVCPAEDQCPTELIRDEL